VKSRTTEQFRKALAGLPHQVRQAYRQFQCDPKHPTSKFALQTRAYDPSSLFGAHRQRLSYPGSEGRKRHHMALGRITCGLRQIVGSPEIWV